MHVCCLEFCCLVMITLAMQRRALGRATQHTLVAVEKSRSADIKRVLPRASADDPPTKPLQVKCHARCFLLASSPHSTLRQILEKGLLWLLNRTIRPLYIAVLRLKGEVLRDP
jgi:hypothetical protein